MMRKLRVRLQLCLSLSCSAVFSASPGFAAPPAHPSAEDDATVAMARERFKEGVGYFDQKQYDKARAAFLQAYALKKHPAVLLNLAQSELRSGHEADAAQHFDGYLREASDASDNEKQAAQAGLAAAKAVVAEIDVNVDERGAEVFVDGSSQGNSPLPGPVYVTPGSHAIEARKDGRTALVQVNASAGRHLEADLEFAPKPPPPAEVPIASQAAEPAAAGSGRKPIFRWLVSSPVGVVGLGLTGVGLASGIGFAIGSKKDYSDADSVASEITKTAASDSGMANPDTTSLCVGPQAWLQGVGYKGALADRASQYSNACSRYQSNVSDGDTLKTVSTVSLVVAGVAAVGTVVYYFVDPNALDSHDSARGGHGGVALLPVLSPGERGLWLLGTF